MSEYPTGDFISQATPSDLIVSRIASPCPAPAPLVVNGSPYVGCQLEAGHDGAHKVTIEWAR